ncbi:GIP, partial [Symbiodinium necroappetens]
MLRPRSWSVGGTMCRMVTYRSVEIASSVLKGRLWGFNIDVCDTRRVIRSPRTYLVQFLLLSMAEMSAVEGCTASHGVEDLELGGDLGGLEEELLRELFDSPLPGAVGESLDPEGLKALIQELKEPVEQVVLRYVVPLKGKTGQASDADLFFRIACSLVAVGSKDGSRQLMNRWVETRYGAPHTTIPEGHVLITSAGNLVASKGFRAKFVDPNELEGAGLPALHSPEECENQEEQGPGFEDGVVGDAASALTPERRLRMKTAVRFVECEPESDPESYAHHCILHGNYSREALSHLLNKLPEKWLSSKVLNRSLYLMLRQGDKVDEPTWTALMVAKAGDIGEGGTESTQPDWLSERVESLKRSAKLSQEDWCDLKRLDFVTPTKEQPQAMKRESNQRVCFKTMCSQTRLPSWLDGTLVTGILESFLGVQTPEDLPYLFEEDLIELGISPLTASRSQRQIPWIIQNRTLRVPEETTQADPTDSLTPQVPLRRPHQADIYEEDYLEMMYLQSMWNGEDDDPGDNWPPVDDEMLNVPEETQADPPEGGTVASQIHQATRADVSGRDVQIGVPVGNPLRSLSAPPAAQTAEVRRVEDDAYTPNIEALLEELQGPLEVVHNVAPADVRAHLDRWKPSAVAEVQSLEGMKAIRRFRGQQAREILRDSTIELIPAKAVCTIKPGEPFKRKFRVVSCGNYASTTEETLLYAGGAGAECLRTLLVYAGRRGRRCYGLDVKSAFLLAPIPAYVTKKYGVRPPKLLVEMGVCSPDEIWIIDRALYGFRESPRWWAEHRDSVLRTASWTTPYGQAHLEQFSSEGNVWAMKLSTGETLGHVLIYVDDFLLLTDSDVAEAFIGWIRE